MNILHNDIKAYNFVISYLGQVVLIDFRIATHMEDKKIYKYDYTGANHILPQVKLKQVPFSIGSDIFAFGKLLYNMGKKYKSTKIEMAGKEVMNKADNIGIDIKEYITLKFN